MRQVIKQVKERNKIDLHSSNINYQLWRLDNDEYKKLWQNSIHIEDDKSFHEQINWFGRELMNKLNLAELFTTLEWLLGKSSDSFDRDKGSFYFPLLLVLEKEIGTFFYGISIFDSKGFVIFRIYKVLNNNMEGFKNLQLEQSVYQLEFSHQERNNFLNLFYDYLVGCFHISQYVISVQPFLKTVDASWITYGYKENKYFEKGYNCEKAYSEAIKSFEEIYGSRWEKTDMDTILRNITS